MKRILSAMAAGAVLAASMMMTAPAAQAGDRTCSGTIRAVTIDDNVIVPKGKTCTLVGTKVKGNIEVRSGATLKASKVRVDGNIQSQGHRNVSTVDSRVDGNIQLKSGGGVNLRRNIVEGDIQLFSNTKAGKKYVIRNTVDGNLQCKGNSPVPYGGGNVVQGDKEDQCRAL